MGLGFRGTEGSQEWHWSCQWSSLFLTAAASDDEDDDDDC